MDDFDSILAQWSKRIDLKTSQINDATDQAVLKAAIYCNEQALQNAMDMIYDTSIPTSASGKPLWKRTGLYKAAMGYGLGYAPHSAMIYNTAQYAKVIEYGDSKGHQGRLIMSNSVFNNTAQIGTIITDFLKGVVK